MCTWTLLSTPLSRESEGLPRVPVSDTVRSTSLGIRGRPQEHKGTVRPTQKTVLRTIKCVYRLRFPPHPVGVREPTVRAHHHRHLSRSDRSPGSYCKVPRIEVRVTSKYRLVPVGRRPYPSSNDSPSSGSARRTSETFRTRGRGKQHRRRRDHTTWVVRGPTSCNTLYLKSPGMYVTFTVDHKTETSGGPPVRFYSQPKVLTPLRPMSDHLPPESITEVSRRRTQSSPHILGRT